ncbi:MAG: sugar phosphate nucleotidyltransferase [Candidatus Omnitrophota bacterium]
MNYAIILAGGSGMRFWPLSTGKEPKQFLNITCGNKPMINLTIKRVSSLIAPGNIYIAAGRRHGRKIRGYIRNTGIIDRNIFLEPQARNTFAPIAYLSKKIQDLDPEAVIIVLPSDHFFKDWHIFKGYLKKGLQLARCGYTVMLGITPKGPATGYGYIKASAADLSKGACRFFKVEKFIEKPDLSKAKMLIKDKRYYWNSGIFIFRADVMLKEISKYAPPAHRIISRAKPKGEGLSKLWRGFKPISIDYAVMEKTRTGALLPVDCGWTDMGSWQSLEEIMPKDKYGNIFKGPCIDKGSENSLVWSEGEAKITATIGLRDMVVVNTRNALLVCPKQRAQEVKAIACMLKGRRLKRHIRIK